MCRCKVGYAGDGLTCNGKCDDVDDDDDDDVVSTGLDDCITFFCH